MELELFSCPFATTPTPVTSLRYPLLFLFLSIFFSRNPTPPTDLKNPIAKTSNSIRRWCLEPSSYGI
jgi:hypothetical protein